MKIPVKIIPGFKHEHAHAFIMLSTIHQPRFLYEKFDGIRKVKKITLSDLDNQHWKLKDWEVLEEPDL